MAHGVARPSWQGMSAGGVVEAAVLAWMAARGWSPFDFQRAVWRAMQAGESGLLHATTGAGKTYAVWLGALMAAMAPAKKTSATM